MAVYLTSSSSPAPAAATYLVAQDATLGEHGADAIHGEPAAESLESGHTQETHAQEAKLPQLRFDTFPSQVFWLAVVFIGLYVILQRSLLPRIHQVLENRANRIQQDLDRAEQYQSQANAARETFEKTQTEARLHVQSVMDGVQQHAKEKAAAKAHEVDTVLRAQMTEAEAGISAARGRAIEQAKSGADALANAIVERIMQPDSSNAARPARRA